MFDLSALDAELDSLGRAPENASSLARSYAGIALSGPLSAQLEQVDAELSALSNGEYQAPVVVPHARATARFDSALSGVVPVAPVESARARASHYDEIDDEFDPVPTLMPNFAAEAPESAEPAPADSMPASDLQDLQARGPERVDDDSLTPLAGEQSGAFANLAQPRSPSLTESQEIVLPDPIAREELSSESGELSLDGGDPESGSFALPDSPTDPRIVSEDMAARAPVTTEFGSRAEPRASTQLLPFDDVQDALEGSQPIAVSGRATQSPKAELDRDPDAEFDALLSEATDPRGMPTHGSSEFDTDDLLRGLEGGDDETPDTEDVTQNDPHEAEMLTRSLYESGDDNTDVLDRATLGELERAARQEQERTQPEPQPESEDTDADLSSLLSPDELDSGELEIIDDEPTLAPQPTPIKPNPLASMPVPPPSARPGLSNKAPPPPPPSSSPEKRPSLLGRFFTKREGE